MLRWIRLFFFVIIALMCIVQNVVCMSLFDLVGQDERVLKNVVDVISATDCSFNEFKKVVTQLEERKARKVYGIVRTIKELSNITNWFNAVKDSPNTASMEGTYLFAHIAHGHFFSPLHGELSSTKRGKSKYYDEDSAWRINDDLRNAFILPFTVLLSNAFLEIMHGILTKEVASSINIDDKDTVLVSGRNIDNFGLLQNSHVSALTDIQGAKKAESDEKLSSISIGINFKDDLKQKPDVTYDINGRLNPLAKTLAVLVSQTISKSTNQRYFDALFQACVDKIAFPKAKRQPAAVSSAGEITLENLVNLTSIIQSFVSGKDEIITSDKSFFRDKFEFPKEIIRSGTLMYPYNSLIFFFEEIASLVFLRNKACDFNHINLITSLIMSPEALCNFQKQIKRYLNKEKPDDAKKLRTELIISNFYPIFGEKKEDTSKEDAERDKDTPAAKAPLESSKSVLSEEAQQVIAAISEINSITTDQDKIKKLIAAIKVKEEEKRTTEKQEQISKETATKFVKWFIKTKNEFSLLQHSSFAEAFGYTWELADTKELERAPLEEYITKQLNLMKGSYNALRQLLMTMRVEYAADSISKPFTFSQSSDISFELYKLTGEELNSPSIAESAQQQFILPKVPHVVDTVGGKTGCELKILNHDIVLQEVKISGQGLSCGFRTVDVNRQRAQKADSSSRNELVQLIIKKLFDPKVTELIAPEMYRYLITREYLEKSNAEFGTNIEGVLKTIIESDDEERNLYEQYVHDYKQDLKLTIHETEEIEKKASLSKKFSDFLSEKTHYLWYVSERLDKLRQALNASKSRIKDDLQEQLLTEKKYNTDVKPMESTNQIIEYVKKNNLRLDVQELTEAQENDDAFYKKIFQHAELVKFYLNNTVAKEGVMLEVPDSGTTGVVDALAYIQKVNTIIVNKERICGISCLGGKKMITREKGQILHVSPENKEATKNVYMIYDQVGTHFTLGIPK